MDAEVTTLDTKVTTLYTKVSTLDTKVTTLNTKVTTLDAGVATLSVGVATLGTEMLTRVYSVWFYETSTSCSIFTDGLPGFIPFCFALTLIPIPIVPSHFCRLILVPLRLLHK